MKDENRKPSRYFCNAKCEYFPCHANAHGAFFNCLFCYCPLYALGDKCGGKFSYLENGIKDCSLCLVPHSPGGYDYIIGKYDEIAAIASRPAAQNINEKPEEKE